jgi:hypothetical protein
MSRYVVRKSCAPLLPKDLDLDIGHASYWGLADHMPDDLAIIAMSYLIDIEIVNPTAAQPMETNQINSKQNDFPISIYYSLIKSLKNKFNMVWLGVAVRDSSESTRELNKVITTEGAIQAISNHNM